MTDTVTVDFTAARVLAVAARDAAVRLRDELQRLRPAAGDDDKKIAAAIIDYCDYLIPECNAAIGAWTTAGDLQPQPKYDPFADPLGVREEKFDPRGVPKSPCGDYPKCETERYCSYPECSDAVCGGKGRADAAAAETPTDPLADLVRRLVANGYAVYRF